jgi:hypothetical protein
MARPRLFRNPKRLQLKLEAALYRETKKKIASFGKKMSYGEYVTRLLLADLRRKRSGALNQSRHLPEVFFSSEYQVMPDASIEESLISASREAATEDALEGGRRELHPA